jgi:hypothetical protein
MKSGRCWTVACGLVVRVLVTVGVTLFGGQVACSGGKPSQENHMGFWDRFKGKGAKDAAGTFAAERDIVIKYYVGDKQVTQASLELPPMRVVTDGLEKRGLPEFELIGIPVSMNNAAAMALNAVAEYAVNKKRLGGGDTWASRLPDGFVVAARIEEVESFGHRRLRLCDVASDSCDSPAKTTVSAMAVSSARAKAQAEQVEEAVALLKASIEWFPGELGAGVRIQNNENLNQNNNLSYLALAAMRVEEENNYINALRRSEDLLLYELGGAMPPVVDRKVLEKDATLVIGGMQEEMTRLQNDPNGQVLASAAPAKGVGFLLSPMVRFNGDGLVHGLAIGPISYRRYFYEDPARTALKDARVAHVAAEIYAKWVSKPEVVLALSRETAIDVYEEGYRFEDSRPSKPATYITSSSQDRTHLPVLSRILASLGRELAAGLTVEEIRARWDVVNDPKAKASAESKLSGLREREGQEILKSYGLAQ